MFRGFFGSPRGSPEKEIFYPTKVRLPLYARPITLRTALERLRISDVRVRHISPAFVRERGLIVSPLSVESEDFSDLPATLNPADLMDTINTRAPVDGVEVVEWMHVSYADAVVMQARIAEYNRLGSEAVGNSGDGYIPGVSVEDIRLKGTRGSTVAAQGYDVAYTPRGNFRIPDLGKNPGIFRDLISWGSFSYRGSVQTGGNLLKWKTLAETPITQTVGFYMDRRGNSAPNFFTQIPPRPALTVTVRQRYETDGDQTLTVNFRDPTDYSRVLGTKSFAVAGGESEATYTVSAFPYVPPTVAEIQPEDGKQTKLTEFVVV